MENPPLVYNKELYDYICSLKKQKKPLDKYLILDEEYGEGVAGTVHLAYFKPRDRFPDPIVVKEQRNDKYAINEYEALCFLREQMLAGRLPGYYIFLYGTYTHKGQKFLILEKSDENIADFMIDYEVNTKGFLEIFWHVANAVDHLERLQFNHGDLWDENIMISWKEKGDDTDIDVKLIDYDSAFRPNSAMKNSSQGGAKEHRPKRFIIGYDLNRFFEALLYTYEDYIGRKTVNKQRKINRARWRNRRNRAIHVPTMDENDSSDDEWDSENVRFTPEIVDFLNELEPTGPDDFDDHPELSGSNVKKAIVECAEKHGIILFDSETTSGTEK